MTFVEVELVGLDQKNQNNFSGEFIPSAIQTSQESLRKTSMSSTRIVSMKMMSVVFPENSSSKLSSLSSCHQNENTGISQHPDQFARYIGQRLFDDRQMIDHRNYCHDENQDTNQTSTLIDSNMESENPNSPITSDFSKYSKTLPQDGIETTPSVDSCATVIQYKSPSTTSLKSSARSTGYSKAFIVTPSKKNPNSPSAPGASPKSPGYVPGYHTARRAELRAMIEKQKTDFDHDSFLSRDCHILNPMTKSEGKICNLLKNENVFHNCGSCEENNSFEQSNSKISSRFHTLSPGKQQYNKTEKNSRALDEHPFGPNTVKLRPKKKNSNPAVSICNPRKHEQENEPNHHSILREQFLETGGTQQDATSVNDSYIINTIESGWTQPQSTINHHSQIQSKSTSEKFEEDFTYLDDPEYIQFMRYSAIPISSILRFHPDKGFYIIKNDQDVYEDEVQPEKSGHESDGFSIEDEQTEAQENSIESIFLSAKDCHVKHDLVQLHDGLPNFQDTEDNENNGFYSEKNENVCQTNAELDQDRLQNSTSSLKDISVSDQSVISNSHLANNSSCEKIIHDSNESSESSTGTATVVDPDLARIFPYHSWQIPSGIYSQPNSQPMPSPSSYGYSNMLQPQCQTRQVPPNTSPFAPGYGRMTQRRPWRRGKSFYQKSFYGIMGSPNSAQQNHFAPGPMSSGFGYQDSNCNTFPLRKPPLKPRNGAASAFGYESGSLAQHDERFLPMANILNPEAADYVPATDVQSQYATLSGPPKTCQDPPEINSTTTTALVKPVKRAKGLRISSQLKPGNMVILNTQNGLVFKTYLCPAYKRVNCALAALERNPFAEVSSSNWDKFSCDLFGPGAKSTLNRVNNTKKDLTFLTRSGTCVHTSNYQRAVVNICVDYSGRPFAVVEFPEYAK